MLQALILVAATVAGYFDFRTRRIPNWLVAATMLAALGWHTAVNGLNGLWMSGAGLLIGIGILLPFFLLRAMGAGDVKLFGALGAAVTYEHVFTFLFLSAVVAAVMALFRIFVARAFVATMRNLVDLLKRFFRGHFTPHPVLNLENEHVLAIPFGVSVAVAAWIFVFMVAR